MTRHRSLAGPIGVVVISLVVLLALFNAGAFGPWIRTLDEHANAVIAMASIVSAAATAAVAIWGYGNWQMYRLEARKHEADIYRLVTRLRDLGLRIGRLHRRWVSERETEEEDRTENLKELRRDTREAIEAVEDALRQIRRDTDDPELIILADDCFIETREVAFALRLAREEVLVGALTSRVARGSLNKLSRKLKLPYRRYERGDWP